MNPYESPREIEEIPAPKVKPSLDQLLALFCGAFLVIASGVLLNVLITWFSGRPFK